MSTDIIVALIAVLGSAAGFTAYGRYWHQGNGRIENLTTQTKHWIAIGTPVT